MYLINEYSATEEAINDCCNRGLTRGAITRVADRNGA